MPLPTPLDYLLATTRVYSVKPYLCQLTTTEKTADLADLLNSFPKAYQLDLSLLSYSDLSLAPEHIAKQVIKQVIKKFELVILESTSRLATTSKEASSKLSSIQSQSLTTTNEGKTEAAPRQSNSNLRVAVG